MRVVHCPVNVAGIPWENVRALRRKGIEARLVVFERAELHPEADWSLDRHGGFARRQATQWAALARVLPHTDVFHFYFGLTLVPKSLQFSILQALGRKSVYHFLGSGQPMPVAPAAATAPAVPAAGTASAAGAAAQADTVPMAAVPRGAAP